MGSGGAEHFGLEVDDLPQDEVRAQELPVAQALEVPGVEIAKAGDEGPRGWRPLEGVVVSGRSATEQ
jgi:hypothetical protein